MASPASVYSRKVVMRYRRFTEHKQEKEWYYRSVYKSNIIIHMIISLHVMHNLKLPRLLFDSN